VFFFLVWLPLFGGTNNTKRGGGYLLFSRKGGVLGGGRMGALLGIFWGLGGWGGGQGGVVPNTTTRGGFPLPWNCISGGPLASGLGRPWVGGFRSVWDGSGGGGFFSLHLPGSRWGGVWWRGGWWLWVRFFWAGKKKPPPQNKKPKHPLALVHLGGLVGGGSRAGSWAGLERVGCRGFSLLGGCFGFLAGGLFMGTGGGSGGSC